MDDIGEILFFISTPGQSFARFRVGEKASVAVFTEHVNRLSIIIMGVFVVSHACSAKPLQVLLAELEPSFDKRRIVITEAESAGNSRRCERGPAAAYSHAATQTVDHAAVAIRGVTEVFLSHFDGLLGHSNAGVASRSQGLYLSDRHRAFIEVATLAGRNVTPAAAAGLGRVREFAGPFENIHKTTAAIPLFFLPHNARKKKSSEAVTIHVASGFAIQIRIPD